MSSFRPPIPFRKIIYCDLTLDRKQRSYVRTSSFARSILSHSFSRVFSVDRLDSGLPDALRQVLKIAPGNMVWTCYTADFVSEVPGSLPLQN